MTNARCAVCAVGRDCAAADGDLAARSLRPAADARALIAAGGGYCTSSDGDASIVRAFHSITDTCALRATSCIHGAAVDLNLNPASHGSAANARRLITASCGHFAAIDGNTAAVSLHPTADSGCIVSAGCGDRTAVNDDFAA